MRDYLRHFMQAHGTRTLRAAAGALAAIVLSGALGLIYAPSAGIITLLSLQNTKRETLRTAFSRLGALLAALLIAGISFSVFGYTLGGFGIYLLVFVGVSYAARLDNAIAMCSVLVVHIWQAQEISVYLLLNELLLFVIGAGIGVALNLTLQHSVRSIRENQMKIDAVIALTLGRIADLLDTRAGRAAPDMTLLGQYIDEARSHADRGQNNALTVDLTYFVHYIDMRRNQYHVLRRILRLSESLSLVPSQAGILAAFLREISASFHECNNASALLVRAEEIRILYRTQPLPLTREEFEARAVLYQLLHELEQFLWLKNTFSESLTEEQMRRFWPDECPIPPRTPSR